MVSFHDRKSFQWDIDYTIMTEADGNKWGMIDEKWCHEDTEMFTSSNRCMVNTNWNNSRGNQQTNFIIYMAIKKVQSAE